MSNMSFASLKTAKTSNGLGGFAFSTRILNPKNQVCPARFLVDSYGRDGAAIDSLDTLSCAGAFDPTVRIDVENALRPQYGEYLNVPQGLSVFNNMYTSQNGDTLGVGRDKPGVLNTAGVYRQGPPNQNSGYSGLALQFLSDQESMNNLTNKVNVRSMLIQQ